jgi:hypothetical protein
MSTVYKTFFEDLEAALREHRGRLREHKMPIREHTELGREYAAKQPKVQVESRGVVYTQTGE